MVISQAPATTSETASSRPHESTRGLLRAGRNDEAIVQLCAVVLTPPKDLDARELLFEAFFQKRDYPPALVLIEELVRLLPQTHRLRKALIVTLSNMRRYTDAIAHASQYIADFGEDLSMLDVLKVAYFYSGKTDLAIQYGQRVIEFRDAAACRSRPPMVMTEPRAIRAKGYFVLVVGGCRILRLWRHDQSDSQPYILSGMDVPVLCRFEGAASVHRLSH
jgi:hypothetical protein